MFALKLLIGLLIIFFLLRKFDFEQVAKTLWSIPLVYVLLTIVLYMLINLMSALKVYTMLMSMDNKKASIYGLYKNYSLSWALGLFVPGKIGELSMIYFLKEYDLETGPSAAIVVIDKLTMFIILTIISTVGFFMFLTGTETIKLLAFLAVGYGIAFFFIFSSFGRDVIKRLILRKTSDKFAGFSKVLFSQIRKKANMLLIFALGFIKWAINGFILYILLLYFNQQASFLQVFIVSSIVTIISYIPITFNGLGLRESSAILLFNLIGLDEAIVLSCFIYTLILAYVLGVFHLLLSFNKLKNIK